MARRPPMAVTSVTIGAPAPRDLAAFYAQLLGWTVTASEPARPGMSPAEGPDAFDILVGNEPTRLELLREMKTVKCVEEFVLHDYVPIVMNDKP